MGKIIDFWDWLAKKSGMVCRTVGNGPRRDDREGTGPNGRKAPSTQTDTA